jgi:hypothetical protein
MRKLPFLLLGISIAACHSKNNITEHSVVNSSHVVKTNSTSTTDGIDNLQTLLVDAPQVFTVAAKTIKSIEAKKGLRITVDANNLETLDGQAVTGDVQVSIKEMGKATDMIANNCPTVADGKMLVSDGAYYVGMTCNGKQLQIKKGKSLQMEFPKFSKTGMELFYGQRNSTGVMNWIPLNKKLENNTEENQSTTTTNNTSYQYTNYNFDRASLEDWAYMPYEFPTAEWRSFEDSTIAIRRDSIMCHFKNLTQRQMWNIMGSPFKISVRDRYKYGMSSWHIIDIRDYASLRWWFDNGYGLFLIKDKNPDSLLYYRNFSIHFSEENLRKTDSINSTIKAADSIRMLNRIRNISPNDINAIVDNPVSKGKSHTRTKASLQYYAPVEINDLGWINCDHFYDAPQGVISLYTLNIKDSIPANIGVYMIFRDINSMLQQEISTDGKNSIVINQQLPLNSKIEFLIYSKMNNKFVQCKETVTVSKNMILPVAFTPVPDNQVKRFFLN